ncbi:fimbrial protein [Amantichitinum ursilacus]|uniref:Laminin-binding fimbrial subunit ElfA n=1 Tax=Amantichitinum ursilacus TaxID=857265 RepID=A0A0N0XMF6_9NEIS|nr:fimbrial protein [Amantichitinum ursilacus]KPC54116.1 Laminin-binding fimbrial subunit ElfA precursor [Amantichitinum ursilacus]
MKLNLLSLATAAALLSAGAFAADGTITFKGNVTSQTCTLAANGAAAKDFTVTLDSVLASGLDAAGKTAGGKAFTLSLSACTDTTGNVRTSFEPGPTVDAATGRLNIDSASTAKNVQIGLKNADNSVIKVGADGAAQNSATYALKDGAATMSYIAEYVATGKATAGTANSSVMYTVTMP